MEISITNPLEADIVWSFNEQEQEQEQEDIPQPYYLLNQFDKPFDTSSHILLSAAPLPEPLNTDSSESPIGGRQLSVPIGSFEDELLKDADDDQPAPAPVAQIAVLPTGMRSDGSASNPAWTVRVDQNIAFVRIPVRVTDPSVLLTDEGSILRFELKLNISMTHGNDASVSLPIRIVF
jgi:hypothetical protein